MRGKALVLGLGLVLLPPAARADEYDRHIAALAERVPDPSFTIVRAPPFVVLGDEDAATVEKRAAGTVKWAVEHLESAFFAKEPDEIIDVWLFKDKESYEKNARALFGETPSTPYGYYSARHKALVMNIATGGGTLVHEIVHPFMRANFPACPAWFNEGLASLYEQSGEKEGRIAGFTNWRLAGLQKTIRAGKPPALAALVATTERQFYDEDRGTNYAAARYLCYYLQEKGLLVKFYRELVARQEEDPSGAATLKRVLGEDLEAFQPAWEKFVMGLRFP